MPLPKGWLDYLPMGRSIPGTKFIPFKVPLKKTSFQCIERNQWFTPAILLEQQPRLRAVIDLTDTLKYYNPKELTTNGIIYKKIRITGGGVIPSRQKLFEFFDAVDELLQKFQHDPDALIGVHCTHGLNRTGYLICKYMVRRLNIRPKKAISRFEIARGYKMSKEWFVDDVLKDESCDNILANPYPQSRPREYSSRYRADGGSIGKAISRTQNQRNWRDSAIRVLENNTRFPQNNTGFLQHNTRFPQNHTSFPQNNRRFLQNNTSFPQNNTRFSQNSTRFLQNNARFPHSSQILTRNEFKPSHQKETFFTRETSKQSGNSRERIIPCPISYKRVR